MACSVLPVGKRQSLGLNPRVASANTLFEAGLGQLYPLTRRGLWHVLVNYPAFTPLLTVYEAPAQTLSLHSPPSGEVGISAVLHLRKWEMTQPGCIPMLGASFSCPPSIHLHLSLMGSPSSLDRRWEQGDCRVPFLTKPLPLAKG